MWTSNLEGAPQVMKRISKWSGHILGAQLQSAPSPNYCQGLGPGHICIDDPAPMQSSNDTSCCCEEVSKFTFMSKLSMGAMQRCMGPGARPWLEYQTSTMLHLQVLAPAVTYKLMHRKCTRICHFQTKKLRNFLQ